jgi:hypothetical protein
VRLSSISSVAIPGDQIAHSYQFTRRDYTGRVPNRREPATAIYPDWRTGRGRSDNSANHDRHAEAADIHLDFQPTPCYPYLLTATGLAYIHANFRSHTYSALAHISFIGIGQSGRSPDH